MADSDDERGGVAGLYAALLCVLENVPCHRAQHILDGFGHRHNHELNCARCAFTGTCIMCPEQPDFKQRQWVRLLPSVRGMRVVGGED